MISVKLWPQSSSHCAPEDKKKYLFSSSTNVCSLQWWMETNCLNTLNKDNQEFSPKLLKFLVGLCVSGFCIHYFMFTKHWDKNISAECDSVAFLCLERTYWDQRTKWTEAQISPHHPDEGSLVSPLVPHVTEKPNIQYVLVSACLDHDPVSHWTNQGVLNIFHEINGVFMRQKAFWKTFLFKVGRDPIPVQTWVYCYTFTDDSLSPVVTDFGRTIEQQVFCSSWAT